MQIYVENKTVKNGDIRFMLRTICFVVFLMHFRFKIQSENKFCYILRIIINRKNKTSHFRKMLKMQLLKTS